MLTDNGELLLKADEMDFVAVSFQPARSSMRVPALLTSGAISDLDGAREEIVVSTHPRL